MVSLSNHPSFDKLRMSGLNARLFGRASSRGVGALTLGLFIAGAGLAVAALPLPVAAVLTLIVPLGVLSCLLPRLALALLLLSIPFASWTEVSIGKFDVTATDLLVAVLVGSWLVRGLLQNQIVLRGGPTIAMALLFFLSAGVSTFVAEDFPSAAKEMIKLAELIAVATYAASTLTRPGDARFALLALLAAGTAEALVGLWQFATRSGPEAFAIGPFMRAYGDFAQPNAFAGYLGMIVPFGVALALRALPEVGPTYSQRSWPRTGSGQALVLGMTLVITAALAASLSRGAWVGIILGLFLMALLWNQTTRQALALAMVGLGLSLALSRLGVAPGAFGDRLSVLFENFVVFDARTVEPTPANWALVERMAHWQAAWGMAMDHPLLGVGPGNYEAAYPRYFLPGWSEALGHAHNYYLNTFAEQGIIGLLIFLGFIVAIFARLTSTIRTLPPFDPVEPDPVAMRRALLIGALGAAVAFSVHNSFDNMFVHGIGVQFGLILGLIEGAAVQHAHRD